MWSFSSLRHPVKYRIRYGPSRGNFIWHLKFIVIITYSQINSNSTCLSSEAHRKHRICKLLNLPSSQREWAAWFFWSSQSENSEHCLLTRTLSWWPPWCHLPGTEMFLPVWWLWWQVMWLSNSFHGALCPQTKLLLSWMRKCFSVWTNLFLSSAGDQLCLRFIVGKNVLTPVVKGFFKKREWNLHLYHVTLSYLLSRLCYQFRSSSVGWIKFKGR